MGGGGQKGRKRRIRRYRSRSTQCARKKRVNQGFSSVNPAPGGQFGEGRRSKGSRLVRIERGGGKATSIYFRPTRRTCHLGSGKDPTFALSLMALWSAEALQSVIAFFGEEEENSRSEGGGSSPFLLCCVVVPGGWPFPGDPLPPSPPSPPSIFPQDTLCPCAACLPPLRSAWLQHSHMVTHPPTHPPFPANLPPFLGATALMLFRKAEPRNEGGGRGGESP